MIVVDTSALIAIVMDEAEAERCETTLGANEELLISAGTLAEALIVAGRLRVGANLQQLLDGLKIDVVPVTAATARHAAAAYDRWGKGNHPAGLNLGDCFAYALARESECPLLYVGKDFARTDITTA